MSRKDALLSLHKNLVAKRDSLRKQLADDLSLTHGSNAGSGDEADVALDVRQSELHSQLAALESRELHQIERAINQIREGHYGLCEHCHAKIPVARLKALPFTTLCIVCQQKQELHGGSLDEDEAANWETVFEYEGSRNDKELTMGDIDIDLG